MQPSLFSKHNKTVKYRTDSDRYKKKSLYSISTQCVAVLIADYAAAKYAAFKIGGRLEKACSYLVKNTPLRVAGQCTTKA